MWQNRELLQTLPYLQGLQQPVIRALSARLVLSHLNPRSGPLPLSSISEEGGLIFPLGVPIEFQKNGKLFRVPANSLPIFCSSTSTLLTEAEFPYLLLRADPARELRRSIPAFRYFWEETLDLPVSLDG